MHTQSSQFLGVLIDKGMKFHTCGQELDYRDYGCDAEEESET